MVNKQLLNKLKQLGINPKETEILNTDSLLIINSLLDAIAQQSTEISANQQQLLNYQIQVTDIKKQLEKRKPRRLSLSSQSSEEGEINNNLSPRVVSSGNRPTTPRTPRTPLRSLSPAIPELEVIKEIVDQQEEEWENNASQLITEAKSSEDSFRTKIKILIKQLNQKDKDLERLETQHQEQSEEIKRVRELNSKNNRTITELKKETQQKEQKIQELEESNQKLATEVEQSKVDIFQIDQKNRELEEEITDEKRLNAELENKLIHEQNEKELLRKNQENINSALLTKFKELNQLQTSAEQEREEFQRIIDEREKAYQTEKKQREEEYQQSMEEFKHFWDSSTPKRGHSRSNSTHSYIIDEQKGVIIFNPKKKNLQTELSPHFTGQNKGNFFDEPIIINSSVVTDDESAKDKKKRKHQSVPLYLTQNPPEGKLDLTEQMAEALNDLISESESKQVLEEQQKLVAEYQALEQAYKDLFDKQPILERTIQSLNEQLLEFKEGKQKDWNDELGQVKYELQEAKSGERTLQTHLAQAEAKISELEEELRQKDEKRHDGLEIINELECSDKQQLEETEVDWDEIEAELDKLDNGMYQMQVLIDTNK